MVNELGGIRRGITRPVAVAMMQKEKLGPELVRQDWRQGRGDGTYSLRGISTIW